MQAGNCCAVCAVASFTVSYKEEERDMFFSSHSFSRLFLNSEEHTAKKIGPGEGGGTGLQHMTYKLQGLNQGNHFYYNHTA